MSGQLLKLLGVSFGIAVAVGEVIGSGILRTPGLVAAAVPIAGAVLALWALGALHALLQANILTELGTMLPRAGGQYVFAHRAFGNWGGLVVGWSMWCAHMAGTAASAIAFAEFLSTLWPPAAGHETGVAAALLLALNGANIAGLRQGRALQISTSAAKAILLLAFVAAAIWLLPNAAPAQFSNAAPPGTLAFAAAYQLIRGAYNGWHAPIYFSEENVEPVRSIPWALLFGIVLTSALYLAVNGALLHVLGAHGLAGRALPFLAVTARFGGNWPSGLFAVGAMITVASCANANVMIGPRVLFALSRDRLLPTRLQSVNAGGSPYMGFVMCAAVSILLALTGAFRLVFGLIAILATLAYLITELGYFTLRRQEPTLARPWRALLHPWLPALAIVIDAVLLALFVLADVRGALIAAGLCFLCLPLARWRTQS